MGMKDYIGMFFVGKGCSYFDKTFEDTSKKIKDHQNLSYFVVVKTRQDGVIIYWEIFGTNNLEEIHSFLSENYNDIKFLCELTHEEDGLQVHRMNKTDFRK